MQRRPGLVVASQNLKRPLPLKLIVDDYFEDLKRLGTREEAAVDEEGGRPGHARLPAFASILENIAPEFSRLDATIEGLDIKTNVDGVLLEVIRRNRSLVLEDLVVILPELFLIVGTQGRLGRRLRPSVVAKRKVAINELDLAAVRISNLL